jgi:DNA primase
VRLLRSYVSRVVLVFDGDAAGARATLRAFPLFAEEGLAVRVLPLPAGMDPDNYVFAHGPEIFLSPWDAAQPIFAFLLETLIATHGLDIEGRVRLLAELKPYVQALRDPVEQDLWLRFTAGRLKVDEANLRLSLTTSAPVSAARLDPSGSLAINLEKNLIKWVLHHPAGLSLEELEEWVQEFEDRELKGIMSLIIGCCREHGDLDVSLLIQRVEEEEKRRQICALALGEEEFYNLPAGHLANDWRRAFLKRRLSKAGAAIKERLARAVADPDAEDLQALMSQRQEIDRQLEALKD